MSDATPIRVEVYSDTVCPWCYIGKRRFERALSEAGDDDIHLTWMPFQLNPQMPPEGMDRELYLSSKFGGAERAAQVYAPIEDAGRSCDIDFHFDAIRTTPNTMRSHRLIHFAARSEVGQDAVVEALFQSYFIDGEDIGDLDVLAACAERAGLDGEAARTYLQADQDHDQVEAQDRMARELGITGVPFFVFERKYAVSGAQPPEMIAKVVRQVREELAAAVG